VRYFSTNGNSVVPKDARERGFFRSKPATFSAISWVPDEKPIREDFERFFIARLSRYDAVAVLVDRRWTHITDRIKTSAFVVPFDASGVENLQNFTQSISARVLRQFGQLLSLFERGDDSRLLTLPMRNFDGDDFRELIRLCWEANQDQNFIQAVEGQLVALRRRERPRRRSEYRHVYAVDDRGRFFRYGLERHSRYATGGLHTPVCDIAGRFRFGKKIDSERHYNVSETEGDNTRIEGDFTDCHGDVYAVKKEEYLNMFANDYFGYDDKRREA